MNLDRPGFEGLGFERDRPLQGAGEQHVPLGLGPLGIGGDDLKAKEGGEWHSGELGRVGLPEATGACAGMEDVAACVERELGGDGYQRGRPAGVPRLIRRGCWRDFAQTNRSDRRPVDGRGACASRKPTLGL